MTSYTVANIVLRPPQVQHPTDTHTYTYTLSHTHIRTHIIVYTLTCTQLTKRKPLKEVHMLSDQLISN